jgi:O-antigen/teichoic acid export membrane protein
MTSTRQLVSKSMAARVAMLPVQAAATAAAIYITVHSVGVQAYATIGLLVGMQALFSFLNLGSGASVFNAAGTSLAGSNAQLYSVLISATRACLLAGSLFVCGVVAVSVFGWMPLLLGRNDQELITSGAIVAAVAIGLLAPLSQGTGVLTARGHTVSAIVASGAANVVAVPLVLLAAYLDARPAWFVACLFGAQVTISALTCWMAAKVVNISLKGLLASVINFRVRGASIAEEARPALVIWLLIPLAYQTDRLLISHLSTASQLASYNLAVQMFSALLSVIWAASGGLWGHFAHARAIGRLPGRRDFAKISTAFGAVGVGLAACYVGAMPTIAGLVSGDRIGVSVWLSTAFGALLVVQAFNQPSAMIQTDAAGLRFTARWAAVMTLANLSLGIALTPPLGAAGPVLASVVALGFALVAPSYVRVRSMLDVPSDG